MGHPRARFVVPFLLLVGTVAALGQQIPRFPGQTREPPLADDSEDIVQARGQIDPDNPTTIRPADHVVPAGPALLPGSVVNPGVVPAQYTGTYVPGGEIPTPVVTLNIEGSDVSPTGQPVVYKLHVRNVSRARAHNVVIRVTPPKDVDRVKADPPPTHDEAETRWEFKALEPGQSRTIEVSYTPKAEEGEVKLQARVQFDFGRGMITRVSAPTLSLKKDGPERIVVGDVSTFRITVTNTGKVPIKDIEVKDFLHKGLVHDDREPSRGAADGRLMSSVNPTRAERTWSISTLGPGQSRTIDYRVKAQTAGKVGSTVLVNAPGVKKETQFDTEVLTANLQMTAEGPEGQKGTVGVPAGYKVAVENRGSAELRNVVVRCVYPPDMRPTRATNGGQPMRESVQWVFKELKPGDRKELSVALVTTTPGNRAVRFSAKADRGSEQKQELRTDFAGVPSLDWDTDAPGTESVGRTMTYRITVSNRGTAPAEKTEVRVDLPANVDLIDTTPASGKAIGPNAKMVMFPAYDVPPGKKTTYLIRVKARSPGEAVTIFSLHRPGSEPAQDKKITHITGGDGRSPAGPPPAKGDPTTIGMNK
ncbi:MAG TPA: NEW3 domain-containing protein [Gemmataceae bacterium]|nr:NEW3 domain-containing protein [Gemmataceae bacterium]